MAAIRSHPAKNYCLKMTHLLQCGCSIASDKKGGRFMLSQKFRIDEKKRGSLLSVFTFIVLVVTFLARGFFPFNGSQVLGYKFCDMPVFFFPAASFTADNLCQHSIPLWNPYTFTGAPFLASLSTAALYPFNILYLLVPVSNAINYSLAIHLLLSALFVYSLSRNLAITRAGSVLSAIIYILAAPMIMHIYGGHMIAVNAMAWTPLIFLLTVKFLGQSSIRYGVLLSVATALQILAGHPQYVFYTFIALVLYYLFSIQALRHHGLTYRAIGLKGLGIGAFLLLGLSLSAIQIAPTIELLKHSVRASASFDWVASFSLPPRNLLTLIIPDFFGNGIDIAYWGTDCLWEMTMYLGIVPLVIVPVALLYKRDHMVRFFGLLVLFSLLMALGRYTPLLKFLYLHLPGFNIFRGSSKWIFLNAFAMAMLAGYGLDTIVNAPNDKRKRHAILTALGICLACIAFVIALTKTLDVSWFDRMVRKIADTQYILIDKRHFAVPGFAKMCQTIFIESAARTATFLLAIAVALLLYHKNAIRGKTLTLLILGVTIVDLFSFGRRYMVTFDSRSLRWDPTIVDFLKHDKEPFRIMSPTLSFNTGTINRFPLTNIYDSFSLRRSNRILNALQKYPLDSMFPLVVITDMNKLTALFNIRYLISYSSAEPGRSTLQRVFASSEYTVYKDSSALPRAFMVYQSKTIKDEAAILNRILSPGFDPSQYAILEEDLVISDIDAENTVSHDPVIKFVEYAPGRIMLETYTARPGLLVLSDTYYPGWKAFVDKRQTRVYRANYMMRAIALPAGSHLVEFTYQPLSFTIGSVVTCLSLFLLLSLLLYQRKKTRNYASAESSS